MCHEHQAETNYRYAFPMQKYYGKLTTEQLRGFVDMLQSLLTLLDEVNKKLETTPAAKFDKLMAGDFGAYCFVYELPFVEHLSLLITALGRTSEVQEMAQAADPQAALLHSLHTDDGAVDKPLNPNFDKGDIVALAYAFGRSMQSMATYGRSISSLLQEVRENNNQDALFKAIRMDRTVMGCPTAMNGIARAQIRNNKAFFKHLRSALGGPSKKELAGLSQMRYAFLILREMGIEDLSEAALEELMVDKLGAYPRFQSGARKNLRAHYLRSRKIKTI